jgi:hypothetical protein
MPEGTPKTLSHFALLVQGCVLVAALSSALGFMITG